MPVSVAPFRPLAPSSLQRNMALGSLGLVLILTGTSAAGPCRAEPLPLQFQASSDQTGKAAAPQPDGAWWRIFNDNVLDGLCETASRDNERIHISASHLAQIRAQALDARAAGKPHLSASLTGATASGPLINAAGTDGGLVQLGAALSWELDVFHRLADTRRAARLDTEAAARLDDATRLVVLGELAQTYFEIRHLDALLDLIRQTRTSYREALTLTEGRFANGSVSELDLERARLELAEIEAELIATESTRKTRTHALAVLAGVNPTSFQLPPTDASAPPPTIPAGLPSELLLRRPDIAAARAGIGAAQLRLGLARRAWMPSLGLTSSGGFASAGLSQLLTSSAQSWTAGLLLNLPIIDGGRSKARTDWASAEVASQAAQYRQTLLVSFREVEDQLVTLESLGRLETLRSQEMAHADKAARLAHSRFDRGMASQLEVLDAQRSALKAQRAALEVQSGRRIATVQLIRALGGGWSPSSDRLASTRP